MFPTAMNVHSPPSPLHPPLLLVVRMRDFYVLPPPLPTLGVDVTIDAFINEDEETFESGDLDTTSSEFS
jgi:hypothetical protein